MEVKILSKKLIKPSSPTPSHLRHLTLTPVDRLAPPIKASNIFYYPAKGATRRLMLKDGIVWRHLWVEYLEAEVEGKLSRLLSRRNEVIEQVIQLAGGEFTNSLASVQVTVFACGGVTIGVRIRHSVVDGFTAAHFSSAWATASRESMDKVIWPSFDLASFLPVKDLPMVKPRPPPKIFGADKVMTRRFIFDGANISSLKAAACDPSFKREPSRVEAVTALIWRALMVVSRAKHGRLRTSLASHAMNLREKIVPPLPGICCGNLYTEVPATFMADSGKTELPNLKDLVGLLREVKFKESVSREDVLLTVIKSTNELHEALGKEDIDVYNFTSWCRFPFYGNDFGWGNPAWMTRCHTPVEMISLQDTECGDGIEAWVTLEKKDMLQFQQDGDIVSFSSNGAP
ncbi:Acetyl-CoA-benzylalcohol acetyltransferase [Vitis vinifera]|uniref:Acetyl-CoA-benzylalcohol acetyltransferase n=1 Tax=Vitis vinifera TaxID=29760 RepID=A0A438C831_VITVI|nr:Acetyl-CoA-benzylalcohol acetyltransferase [Vitis vinifera]RVW69493.1 Acetyl-CoA-benzylalcohol acetyltransferase [Vitis vinifera]